MALQAKQNSLFKEVVQFEDQEALNTNGAGLGLWSKTTLKSHFDIRHMLNSLIIIYTHDYLIVFSFQEHHGSP